MMRVFVLILLSFAQLYANTRAANNEFDECDKSVAGTHFCRKQQECESVERIMKDGEKSLKLCSKSGNVTIVCCPPSKLRSGSIKTSQTTKPKNEEKEKKESNSTYIVEQMCRKYAEEQYEAPREYGGIDIANPDYADKKVFRCFSPSIVQPDATQPKELPHMALIGFGADLEHVNWLCVGSLISDRYVLSAAHCSNGGKTTGGAKWARLGEMDYSTKSDGAQPVDYEIIERIIHPEYKAPPIYNDIALFKLDKVVVFNAFVRPICLNTVKDITHKEAISAGWGVTSLGSGKSEKLLKFKESIIPFDYCSQNYSGKQSVIPRGIDADTMLCAGVEIGAKDTCQGFGGGPLMVKVENEPCLYLQIGIISFGNLCGRGYPGVFTRISYYLPWIQKIVWP